MLGLNEVFYHTFLMGVAGLLCGVLFVKALFT